MGHGINGFFELMKSTREKSVDFSPFGLTPLLGSQNVFEHMGEWLVRNALVDDVSFELWLRERKDGVAAHFSLSDERFNLVACRLALAEVFGYVGPLRDRNGTARWITYDEADSLRQATFIFDGNENSLFLEMVVVG